MPASASRSTQGVIPVNPRHSPARQVLSLSRGETGLGRFSKLLKALGSHQCGRGRCQTSILAFIFISDFKINSRSGFKALCILQQDCVLSEEWV